MINRARVEPIKYIHKYVLKSASRSTTEYNNYDGQLLRRKNERTRAINSLARIIVLSLQTIANAWRRKKLRNTGDSLDNERPAYQAPRDDLKREAQTLSFNLDFRFSALGLRLYSIQPLDGLGGPPLITDFH